MPGERLDDWLRDPSPAPGRLAVRSAADRARSLAVALLRADTERLEGGDLDDVVADLDRALARLGELPAIPEDATPAGPKEKPTFLSERSPISGAANVGAAPLVMEHLSGMTRGVVTYSELHEGPGRHVHGGIISSTFDELLGVAQVHSGAAGYTVDLTIRFHKIMPLFEPIVYEAVVAERNDKRIHVEGRAFREAEPDLILASAEGTFIAQLHLPIPEHLHSGPASAAS